MDAAALPLPPGPRGPLAIARYNLRFLREPADALAALHAEFGPVARVRLGPLAVVQVVGPEANRLLMTSEDVRSGPVWDQVLPFYRGSLLALDGPHHRAQRDVMAGGFRRERVGAYLPAMIATVAERVAAWAPRLDLYAAMQRLALALAARTLYGFDLGADEEAFLRWNAPMARMILTVPGHDVPLTPRWRGRRAQARMWELIAALIARRRRAGLGDDTLSSLIAAYDAGRIDRDELVVHAFTLLAAGHETSAAFLTFALAIAAVRPELRARMEAEGGEPLALHRLPFTLQFLREVERLYPPTPYLARRAARDLALGGYRIPRGTTLLGGLRLTHLSPACFADPLRFDPDRFAPPRDEHRAAFALAGFGGGPHLCLGVHFAQLEACVVLHTLLRSHRWSVVGDQAMPRARFRPFAEPAAPIVVDVTPR